MDVEGAVEPMGHPQYRVFSHLNAEKASLYRAILHEFSRAREQFVIHLRSSEILTEMRRQDTGERYLEETDIEQALQQLKDWGNLTATRDTSEAMTVEDFYRARYLYQFSAEGEAAEAALQYFTERIEQPGELQTAALEDIMSGLQEVQALVENRPFDEGKLLSAFRALVERFEELTSRAQTFMRSLQERIDLYGISQADFLVYKDRLIDYLERFIGDLVQATNRIADKLLTLNPLTIDEALTVIARRELVDALEVDEKRQQEALETWRRRWRGLERWFLGEADKSSQADVLRARARSAIPALLATLANINDRRSSRSDRAADWQELALWFAETNGEAEAHCLWRAAFSLNPCRHFIINDETIEAREAHPVSQHISWLEAEPVWLTPRLRKLGRSASRGPAKAVIDRSAEKVELQRLAAREAEQMSQARAILATDNRLRLSVLTEMDHHTFDLFLDLLGEALSKKTNLDEIVEATSTDGTLSVILEPIVNAPWVTIHTRLGSLKGHDHWITIRDAFISPRSISAVG